MSVARLPANVNGSFICIREALEACLTALLDESESSFSITFFNPQIPVLSFYLQAEDFNGDGHISIEAQRVTATEDIVLQARDARAKVLGWTVPSSSSTSPNYTQSWKLDKVSIRVIADELVEAARYLGKVSPSAWISFGEFTGAETITRAGYLWRSENNPELFCQMGHNISTTIEGKAQIIKRS